MASYVCRIGLPDGAIAVRTIDAPDEDAVRAEIQRQGGRLFSVKQASGGRGGGVSIGGLVPGRKRRVKLAEFMVFNQELVALLRAGLPIVSGFDILLERQTNPRFKAILADVRDQLVSGTALSDAFLSHGDAFPRLYSTSLKAGERSGEVEKVLRRFLQYQKILTGVKRKVTGALVYPLVLVTLSIGLIFILLTYVIPKFTEFYSGFDAGELPFLTLVVVGTANFLRAHVLLIVLSVVGTAVFLARWKKTKSGALAWDGLLLKLPLVGMVLQQFALSQFSRALATLVAAGTPLVPALEISAGSISNRKIVKGVEAVVPRVREGAELWRSLEDTGQFTSLAVEMIKVGEATGALEEMLTNVSEFYDEAIESTLQKLVTLIEPIILVIMAGVIGTILLSVYLPMFSIIVKMKT